MRCGLKCETNMGWLLCSKCPGHLVWQSLQTSRVTMRSISTPPRWDASEYYRVTPSIKYIGIHLYTWVDSGTVWVEDPAPEHRARTQTA